MSKKLRKSNDHENSKKKERKSFSRWFKRVILRKDVLKIEAEEMIETPLQIVAQKFFSRKTALFGVITFTLILIFVLIGPLFMKIDLGEQDSTLIHIPPTYSMMKVPKELRGNIKKISVGRTYGLGLSNDGDLYVWGHSKISESIDIKEIPPELKNVKIKDIAAGDDHAVVIDEDGKLYIWGHTRLGQDMLNEKIMLAQTTGEHWDIVQLEAGDQVSAALDKDGFLYLWGNENNYDLKIRKAYQGNIAKVALASNEYISLLKDGTVAYTGFKGKGSPYSQIPEPLLIEGNAVDVAATGKSMAGVTKDGQVYVWGKADRGERDIPEFKSKVVALKGGRFHYTALLEDGSVISWGENGYKQTNVTSRAKKGNVKEIYVGYFQNYAIMDDDSIETWGLKGFLLGTDGLGRDMVTRIINGGRITMLVGAIAVIIATIIGIILGGIAGYFGGKVDIIIMRISEVIGGLPFIPFAMILSAVIGSRLDPKQRMYLIMIVLGVLSWVGTCRLVRAQFFAQREMEYVTAAKAMGIRESGIIFRHILPNIFSILLVSMTLDFATCMLTESTLSYLGFGIPLPTPTWGNLLSGANNSIIIQQYWWRWVFPAAIFGLCTICINLIGDALRDAMDPKSSER